MTPTARPLRFRRVSTGCLVALVLFLGSGPFLGHAWGQDDDESGPAPFQPGLVAEYSDDARQIDRLDDNISFHWGTQSPDPRLATGRFRVVWRGNLLVQEPGTYQLRFFVSGHVRLRLRDQLLLDATVAEPAWLDSPQVELPFGFHPIEVEYAKTAATAQIGLHWLGPKFVLEPIGERYFYHPGSVRPPDRRYERGRTLTHALRCRACHEIPGTASERPAPALEKLATTIRPDWLVEWLMTEPPAKDSGQRPGVGLDDTVEHARRMPYVAVTRAEAHALAAWLTHSPSADGPDSQPGTDSRLVTLPAGDATAGRRVFLTAGCLACHRLDELGESGLFGGGDLTQIANKRLPSFFETWLADPASLNRDQRMPVFPLTDGERADLAHFLSSLREEGRAESNPPAATPELIAQGRRLFSELRCDHCHRGPDTPHATTKVSRLSSRSDWNAACSGSSRNAARRIAEPRRSERQPLFVRSEEDQQAIRYYVSEMAGPVTVAAQRADLSLNEHNCLACHARGTAPGLAAQLPAVVEKHAELAPLVAGMTPPNLASVGDKLHDDALESAIRNGSTGHRPWLHVKMPRFQLAQDELARLVKELIEADRIPAPPAPPTDSKPVPPTSADSPLAVAGRRLVTTDGFGCTSCHQIGKVVPPLAPLAARGPDLTLLERRIRREWFDRWVRGPSRIVPRMEMPSVQQPVRGVLDDHLDHQLEAVWRVLNELGFEPPEPNPVQIVRQTGIAAEHQRAEVLTDVLIAGKTRIKPLLIGLPNRHNLLFDLELNQLASWTIGDVARQRTKGKSWFWESAGTSLLESELTGSDLTLVRGQEFFEPIRSGQFATEVDDLEHVPGGVRFKHRLLLADHAGMQCLAIVSQTVTVAAPWPSPANADTPSSGVLREIRVSTPDSSASSEHAPDAFAMRVLSESRLATAELSADRRRLILAGGDTEILVREPSSATFGERGDVVLGRTEDPFSWGATLEYRTRLPVDQFPHVAGPVSPQRAVPLHVVPGFEGTQLPITDSIMPTALAWRPDGTLLAASLKGRVWLVQDSNGDSLEDQLIAFSDELAAPFGVAAAREYVDVITKSALLRLWDKDGDGRAERVQTLASGWGHTADYHDWAMGLPQDADGHYYLATACQQDDRSPAAAHLRGAVIRLVPRAPTAADPREFALDPISFGHRFPMGLARSRAGELFVTDNQGNYNPFNELNRVVRGAHYGFVNAIESHSEERSLTLPAIDIPHPWTRSVNGICFLDTPESAAAGGPAFGPWEGHLIGCEYDTQRLIRMTLEQVGDSYQGAAYPFSYYQAPEGPPLLGPLVCAVSPRGDLYVGCLRDSGWGGANNVGSIVRLRPQRDRIPAGIAEVRLLADGFEIDFARPVNRRLAADPANYHVTSYTRTSTPAYGGPDEARRSDPVLAVTVSADSTQARIRLAEIRRGFVYEIHLQNLAGVGTEFFPAEAYYTVRSLR